MDMIEPEAKRIVEHFEKPIPKEQSLIVDEAMILQYAEVVADIKALEKAKEHMKPLMLSQRCGNEKSATVGKALLLFNTVDAQTGIDWEKAYKEACGPMPPEDVKKYTVVTKKGYTSVEVKKL